MSYQITLFNAIPAGAIETLFDEHSQPYFKRADLGRFLGLENVRRWSLDNQVIKTREEIGGGGVRTTYTQPGQNSHNIFVTLGGALAIVHRSRKPKAVELMKWLAGKGVEKLQDELEKQRQTIEDGEMALAFLNDEVEDRDNQLMILGDDLEDRDRQLMVLEDDLQEREEEIGELRQRAVPHLESPGKDNSMAVIRKNNDDPWPYLAICGQQGYVAQKIRNKLVDYPKGEIVVLAETPNSIVHYNWLRERGCIEVNPERVRHFRLGEHYTHERLLALAE